MDSKEIDKAMKNKLPVMYEGQRYDRILEYVMWYDNNRKRQLSVVLLQGNNSFRVPADMIEFVEV